MNGYFGGQIDSVKSGLLLALKHILRVSSNAGVSFEMLVEAIANNFVQTDFMESSIENIKWILDLIDDELLSMNEDFACEDDGIDWVEHIFKQSLALIQANEHERGQLIQLLQARVSGIKTRIKNKMVRKQVIATGLPFSVALEVQKDSDYFRQLADDFILEYDLDSQSSGVVSKYIRKIEEWVFEKINSLIDEKTPPIETLDLMRDDWILGLSLRDISANVSKADDAVKYFYDFTLPWVIHAISQIFDPQVDEDIFRVYSLLAQLIELGLPNITAINVFLAGVRSRSASVEIAGLDVINGKSVEEIKFALLDFPKEGNQLGDHSIRWLDNISASYKAHKPRVVSFSDFTLSSETTVKILYVRENEDVLYLVSADGHFSLKVKSTNELPFKNIANLKGLYFELNNNVWQLRTYNPQIAIE